jgi:hypothetical protein
VIFGPTSFVCFPVHFSEFFTIFEKLFDQSTQFDPQVPQRAVPEFESGMTSAPSLVGAVALLWREGCTTIARPFVPT